MAGDQRSLPARLRSRLDTVRVRTTLSAVVVVGVALAVGILVLVATLRATLTDDVRRTASLRASGVAAALEAGDVPPLAVAEADEQLVQVVGPDGDVVAASGNVDGLPAVAQLRPGETTRIEPAIGDDEFVAVAAAADTGGEPLTVIVAHALDAVADATEAVAGLLALGAPVLLALVALTTWKVVGRALAPVEAIRTEVEEISSAELNRRVPRPRGQDEIGRLADTMNRMLGRLEEGQQRQRRFVADASHELRSPVASIRQHAEVAATHPGRTSVEALAEPVLAETLRVQCLVDDLLLLARADERSLQLHRRPVDLDDVVFDEATRLRSATPLRVDTRQVSAGRVDGDQRSLQRVLRNLGDNAARHAAATVAFALAERDGTVEVLVDDDGPGIPEAERQRVLERFVRLDDGRARDAGGAGLGLAIVAELVAAHGGDVSIADSPLGGARITLRLPAAGRRAAAAATSR